jgi:hypothetical protein
VKRVRRSERGGVIREFLRVARDPRGYLWQRPPGNVYRLKLKLRRQRLRVPLPSHEGYCSRERERV